jgi:hypothetical protein
MNTLSTRLSLVVLAALHCFATAPLRGQSFSVPDSLPSSFADWIKVSGSASAFGELYFAPGAAQQRRPLGTARLVLRPTFTVLNQCTLPFEIFLSTESSQFRQPFSFNAFSLAPQFGKNVKLYAGLHTLSLSPLSMGDVRVNGGGFDVIVGNVRFVGTGGESRQAVVSNSANFIAGEFSQTLLAGRVEYRSDSGTVIGLNAVRARDNPLSLENTENVQARDNTVLTLDWDAKLFSAWSVQGEIGVSRNGGGWFAPAGAGCGFGEPAGSVSADNLRLDVAGRLAVAFDNPDSPVSVQLRSQYIGPGYVTLGFPQLINDRFEVDIAPRARLFDNKLTLSGSLGVQLNNLASDQETQTRRIISSANVSTQPVEWFGLDVIYQNYGIRVAPPVNYGIIDTVSRVLQVQNVFAMLSVAPRFSFTLGQYLQNVNLTFSTQGFSDANPETRQQTENTSQSYRLLWMSLMQQLTLTFNAGYTNNRSAFANFAASDFSLMGGYSLFSGKLTPTLTLMFTPTSESSGLQNRITAQLRASYTGIAKTTMTLFVQANRYNYAPTARTASYNEGQASLEIRYQW